MHVNFSKTKLMYARDGSDLSSLAATPSNSPHFLYTWTQVSNTGDLLMEINCRRGIPEACYESLLQTTFADQTTSLQRLCPLWGKDVAYHKDWPPWLRESHPQNHRGGGQVKSCVLIGHKIFVPPVSAVSAGTVTSCDVIMTTSPE